MPFIVYASAVTVDTVISRSLDGGCPVSAKMVFTDSVIFQIALLAIGIAGIWVGADSAVEGAARLSEKLGISRTVAGLTIIAVGTSLPELCICLIAALKDSADIATGNIVGSNVSNICLIMGICAALVPIQMRQSLTREAAAAPVFLGILIFLCGDGKLDRGEGFALTAVLVPLVVYMYLRQAKKPDAVSETGQSLRESNLNTASPAFVFFITATGLAALAVGSNLVVESAVGIADGAGVPKLVVGATAVAVGTSLPELAASLAAVARREHSMAIGNIAGSNLFNIIILGLTSSILPLSIDPKIPAFQLPFAVLLSGLTVPFMRKGATVGRGAGIFLLLLYGFFVLKTFYGS